MKTIEELKELVRMVGQMELYAKGRSKKAGEACRVLKKLLNRQKKALKMRDKLWKDADEAEWARKWEKMACPVCKASSRHVGAIIGSRPGSVVRYCQICMNYHTDTKQKSNKFRF